MIQFFSTLNGQNLCTPDFMTHHVKTIIDFVFLICYRNYSYITDGFSGIDHGEYSSRADRLGMKSPDVRRFCFYEPPVPGNWKGMEP